jgi:hypothetical protein
LATYDKLAKTTKERKSRRAEAEVQTRARLEVESVERDRYGTGQEGDKASKKPVPKRRDSTVSNTGSDILWEDENPAGPGGLTDDERKEVDEGHEEGIKDVEKAKEHDKGSK